MQKNELLQTIVDDASAAWPSAEAVIEAPIHTIPDGERRHRMKIMKSLADHPVIGGEDSLHIGVAGYFNFDIITKTRPAHVLLLDANTNQQRFWQELFTMLAANDTPEAFTQALAARTVDSHFICEDGTALYERINNSDAMYGLECLQEGDNYVYLHQLAIERRAAFATVNLISENKKCEAIGRAIREAGLHADTAYWSNIGSFFHPSRAAVLVSRDDDVFGQKERQMFQQGLNYKNKGFYQGDGSSTAQWNGYDSQEERNRMDDAQVPAYERFLENTSALGGMKTVHMHANASDKLQNIKRFPLILSDGPMRRLPEQREAREKAWKERMDNEAASAPKSNERS